MAHNHNLDRRSAPAGSEPTTAEKTLQPTGERAALHPAFFIANWIFFSNLTILFNKWLIDTAGFRYPVILACWHLMFATVATQLLARTTSLLDGRHGVKMTARLYLRAIVPIGLLYSASLVCSNLVYIYLSVAFIQMLKAASPVAVLLVGWTWGVEKPNTRRVVNVLLITLGVGVASAAELHFSWPGVLFQFGAIAFEAIRLILIQVLLNDGVVRMDPLVSLYYFAPVCAVTNLAVALATEWRTFSTADLARTGWPILVLNAAVAFVLNVASVLLVGRTSGLVLTLAGILKNVLLVLAAVLTWHTAVTALQLVGYAVALVGLLCYSLTRDQLAAAAVILLDPLAVATDGQSRRGGFPVASPALRRAVALALASTVAVVVLVAVLDYDVVAVGGGVHI